MKRILFFCLLLLALAATAQAQRTYVLNGADADIFYNSFQFALENSPAQQLTSWVNPATGLNGSTIPTRDLRLANGQYCREYLATVALDGMQQQAYGTACRQVAGNWKITAEKPILKYAAGNSHSRTTAQLSTCPRHHWQGKSQAAVLLQLVPRSQQSQSVFVHQFLFKKPAQKAGQNWKELHDLWFKSGSGQEYRNWTHPPIKQKKFEHKPSKLLKLVGYEQGDARLAQN